MQNKYIPLGKISEYLGYKINPATAHRWRQKGVFHNGERVVLESKKIGSRYFVTEEDLNRFISKLNTSSSKFSELPTPLNGLASLDSVNQADQILDGFHV